MNDGLVGKIMRKLDGLRAETYSYLTADGIEEEKKSKDIKKCKVCHKKETKF